MGEDRGKTAVIASTQNDERGEDRKMVTVTRGTQTVEISKDGGGQLLPGILNEITLDHITTKLPWCVCVILSSVSRSWQKAFRSRKVYEARVRTNSTETLVAVSHEYFTINRAMTLYSFGYSLGNSFGGRAHPCYQLPPIPSLQGIWEEGQRISLDGKLHFIGGGEDKIVELGSAEVFVLDMAGQMEWKQCAKMLEARKGFGCGIFDGRIYVFGGMSLGKPICGSEVYDPKRNVWSPITPMPSLRFGHYVAAVGDELCLYGGEFVNREFCERYPDGDNDGVRHVHPALFLEFYNPVTNEWRRRDDDQWRRFFEVGINGSNRKGTTFTENGKFYSVTQRGLDVYDFDRNLWENSRDINNLPDTAWGCRLTCRLVSILVIDDELLAIATVSPPIPFEPTLQSDCLLHSIGFRDEGRKIVWELETYSSSLAQWPTPLVQWPAPFVIRIQL